MVPSRAMSWTSLRALPLTLVLSLLLVVSRPAHAEESEDMLVWDLVTVGPAPDLFSLWGHSALCVSKTTFDAGWCFDFGIAREHDPVRLAVGTLRGEPHFAAVKLPAEVLLAAVQFRDAWSQRLPIEPELGRQLLAELDASVDGRERYAYQPLFRNCTTELRDRLDRALSGRLSRQAHTRGGVPLRVPAERGLSGQVLPLALVALAGGTALDRPSTAWERMALPEGLMQGVKERLSAAPSRLLTRSDAPPPTSPNAGRIVLLLLTALGSASYLFLARRRPHRQRLLDGALASWLVLLSLVPLIGTATTLPSLHQNWMLAVVVPLDALLLLGPRFAGWQKRYVDVRLMTLALLAALSLGGVIAQALTVGVLLAALPLGAWRLTRR